MTGQDLAIPAGASAAQLEFGEMLRRAKVLANTELVPKPLQGKPEAIVVIGVWGAEHGVPLMTAIQEVHVIENRPSPSAQLRLALIRRAGHEARFVESDSTRAVLRARRREYRHDPDAWVTVTYTIDDARRAGLLDRWAEDWIPSGSEGRKRKHTWKVGDDHGPADLADAPDWVRKAVAAGDIRSKDNWQKYPADMLRARAASVMSRMEFSDVLAALAVDEYTPEELGLDVGQDLDEPAASEDGPVAEHDDGGGEVIDEAVVVEDLASEPEERPSADAQPPAPGESPAAAPAAQPSQAGDVGERPQEHPVPHPKPGERPEVTILKYRLNSLDSDGKKSMRAWLAANDIDDVITIDSATVAAINAELDRRGVPHVKTTGYEGLLPPDQSG